MGVRKAGFDCTIDSTLLPFTGTLTRRRRNNFVRNYCFLRAQVKIQFLRKDVLERRTSTGSDAFFRIIELEATKFVLLSVSTLTEIICSKIWAKPHCIVTQNLVLSLRASFKKRLYLKSVLFSSHRRKNNNKMHSGVKSLQLCIPKIITLKRVISTIANLFVIFLLLL